MNTIVTKFGGSSLSDANQFRKVKNIINSNSDRKYVIVSAPGKRTPNDFKVTDILYLCFEHIKSSIPLGDIFKLLSDRYASIIEELNIELDLNSELEEIKTKLENGASRDYAASRGEYLNGLILSKFLGFTFLDPKDFIKFNNHGSLDYSLTLKNLKEELSKHETAVIPGFYGSDLNENIITFSRGGSDVTGSLVSASINAKLYENWTDVSGFLMADPRIVENPKQIDFITYRELRELSYMGASILHEESVFPVKNLGIPINIKNTNEPSNPGTFIVKNKDFNLSNTVTGIAGKQNFTVISIEKAMMNSELGFCRKILSILEMNNISFENMPSGIDSICLVISDSELKNKTDILIDEINRTCNPDSIIVHPNLSLIATVGEGMISDNKVASKICTSLSESDINIRLLIQGSSELNILVGVEDKHFKRAINSLYNSFN